MIAPASFLRGLCAAVLLVAPPALAGDPPPLPFPLQVGGAFELTDQDGAPRSEKDPDGHVQLIFFGYAKCEAICSAALPLMADVVDELNGMDIPARPVMITIDPERDTVAEIGPALIEHHPDFIGLTGTMEELQEVWDLFSIERTKLFDDPEYGPIYAHGSHIYLLDAEGEMLTLLPPILSVERIAEIVDTYVGPGAETGAETGSG